jgi:hypothetical protein
VGGDDDESESESKNAALKSMGLAAPYAAPPYMLFRSQVLWFQLASTLVAWAPDQDDCPGTNACPGTNSGVAVLAGHEKDWAPGTNSFPGTNSVVGADGTNAAAFAERPGTKAAALVDMEVEEDDVGAAVEAAAGSIAAGFTAALGFQSSSAVDFLSAAGTHRLVGSDSFFDLGCHRSVDSPQS